MYFGTGGKILFWASDSSEVHLRLRLNVWTYNYVGTLFGGSMFSASDPFYMVMLLRSLGPSYVVWDKAASITFRKPAKKTLYAKLAITHQVLEEIKERVKEQGRTTHDFLIQWMDREGVVYAEIQRHCYIASKEYYKKKKGETQTTKLDFKLSKK